MQLNRKLLLSFLFFLLPVTYLHALPTYIDPPGEKLILFDPREHAWGAYTANGTLIRTGLASGGANWCEDMGRQCHTDVGVYRIRTLGGSGCFSPSFPVPNGGAPMPYCMYYTQAQALHGSNHVVYGNISHGCIRVRVSDARWIRYNFAERGTLIVVQPY